MQTGHAIITGGSSGIGLALASQLAGKGWTISLIARNIEKLKEACTIIAAESKDSKLRVHGYNADVSNQQILYPALEKSIENHGPPCLLITSAGIAKPGHFTELDNEDFERQIAVNYLGTLYAVKYVVPYMLELEQGHIVMISSGAGLMGLFGYSAYAPSKFAVRGLAESLRAELRPGGINVSVVYPPDTRTPQLLEEEKTKPEETRRITDTGGIMSAEDVASSIIHGIYKNKSTITPGIAMTFLYRLHSLVGPVLQFYFDRLVNKVNNPSK